MYARGDKMVSIVDRRSDDLQSQDSSYVPYSFVPYRPAMVRTCPGPL